MFWLLGSFSGGDGIKQLRGGNARQDSALVTATRAISQECDKHKGSKSTGKRARGERNCACPDA